MFKQEENWEWELEEKYFTLQYCFARSDKTGPSPQIKQSVKKKKIKSKIKLSNIMVDKLITPFSPQTDKGIFI